MLEILFGLNDTCASKFNTWVDSNRTSYSKERLWELNFYATQGDCENNFDSLLNHVKLRKEKDSILAIANRDTIINFEQWAHDNSTNYTQEEINDFRGLYGRNTPSKWFYSQVKAFDDNKKIWAEQNRRRSFAHLAVNISNSDSIEFILTSKDCKNLKPTNATQQSAANCANYSSRYNLYYDFKNSLRAHNKIKRIGAMFINEIIKNDSVKIYRNKHDIGTLAFGCGWSLDALLIIYYDDLTFRIDFDGINHEMYYDDGSQAIQEYYSPKFYDKLLKSFGFVSSRRKPSGCGQ